MPQPIPLPQIAAEARAYLRAAAGCPVRIAWLHRRIGCAMADLIAALDTMQDLVRVRGSHASVMLG